MAIVKGTIDTRTQSVDKEEPQPSTTKQTISASENSRRNRSISRGNGVQRTCTSNFNAKLALLF